MTGHQRLPDPKAWDWVAAQLQRILAGIPLPLAGITSLAIGADQLFAKAVLSVGGSLEAIIPFAAYAGTFSESDRAVFENLLKLSSRTEVLTRAGSDEECYMAAGRRVVDLSDLMLAVWNGRPAQGLGGTADIVRYAQIRERRVIRIDPFERAVIEG